MRKEQFACWPDFTPEKALFEAIWYPCEGEPAPLVKRAVIANGEILTGSGVGWGSRGVSLIRLLVLLGCGYDRGRGDQRPHVLEI